MDYVTFCEKQTLGENTVCGIHWCCWGGERWQRGPTWAHLSI